MGKAKDPRLLRRHEAMVLALLVQLRKMDINAFGEARWRGPGEVARISEGKAADSAFNWSLRVLTLLELVDWDAGRYRAKEGAIVKAGPYLDDSMVAAFPDLTPPTLEIPFPKE